MRSMPLSQKLIRFLKTQQYWLIVLLILCLVQSTFPLKNDIGFQILDSRFEHEEWTFPTIPSHIVWRYLQAHPWEVAKAWFGQFIQSMLIHLTLMLGYLRLGNHGLKRYYAVILGAWPWVIPIVGISLYRRKQPGIGAALVAISIIPCTVIGGFWILWVGLSVLDGLKLLTGNFSLYMSEITHSFYTLYGIAFPGIFWLGIFLAECVIYCRNANRDWRRS